MARRAEEGLTPGRLLVGLLPLAWLLAGCGGAAPAATGWGTGAPPPAWTAAADVDGDGATEAVAAWFDAGRRRGVVAVARGERRWTSPIYPMWKARVADLDGDGRDEVLLGIWSHRRRHDEPQPHRTVWVLGWEDGRLRELWRGSALARPLVDFEVTAADRGGGASHLVAWERPVGAAALAPCVRSRYRWTGFGFTGAGRTDGGPTGDVVAPPPAACRPVDDSGAVDGSGPAPEAP